MIVQDSAPSAERAAAKAAGLHYSEDRSPGISRRIHRDAFVYHDAKGARITDKLVCERLRKLAIPPAYTDVWICASPQGHLQATGRDARGRKQYRYHLRWRESRDATKYQRMEAFGLALPRIRRRIKRDLALRGLPRDKLLAAILRLLEITLIRIGNDEYARDNGSFGLTTLRSRHVSVRGSQLRFSFRGKSGIQHVSQIDDPRLAGIVKRCMDLPGHELFQYLDDDGERRSIGSADVNDYLRDAAGGADFTAKDYRTWAGSVMALHTLRSLASEGQPPVRQRIVETIKQVAIRLGNTPAVCRKCYVHPSVLDAYLENRLAASIPAPVRRGLRTDEAAFLAFIRDLEKASRVVRRRAVNSVK